MLLFICTALLFVAVLLLFMVAVRNRAEIKTLNSTLEKQAFELEQQQELLARNINAQEDERRRIAAQLHDDICSKLGVLHLSFHRLRRTEPIAEKYEEMSEEINDLIATTLETTRDISHELVPPTLEGFGLIEALEELCEQIRNTGAVDIRFEHNINREDISDVSTELNLYRIVQELTNNTLKYAEASFIHLQLIKEDNQILLSYSDNGKGFDPKSDDANGLGLKNIRNRVKIIGAHSTMSTSPGHGFEMNITQLI
jgi:signal transduction histidine kinase